MTALGALWLPILLAAVIVFIASSIIHTMLPWHKGDYASMPNEDRVSDALRPFAIPPGDYMIPRPATQGDFKSPEFVARVQQGPNMIVTVLPNEVWSMGRSLGMWFVYLLVIGIFAAYVASRALPTGATYLEVFRFVGTTAFMGYALALWQMAIWYRRSWSVTVKSTIDGLVYACLTAGTFGWLWPR